MGLFRRCGRYRGRYYIFHGRYGFQVSKNSPEVFVLHLYIVNPRHGRQQHPSAIQAFGLAFRKRFFELLKTPIADPRLVWREVGGKGGAPRTVRGSQVGGEHRKSNVGHFGIKSGDALLRRVARQQATSDKFRPLRPHFFGGMAVVATRNSHQIRPTLDEFLGGGRRSGSGRYRSLILGFATGPQAKQCEKKCVNLHFDAYDLMNCWMARSCTSSKRPYSCQGMNLGLSALPLGVRPVRIAVRKSCSFHWLMALEALMSGQGGDATSGDVPPLKLGP